MTQYKPLSTQERVAPFLALLEARYAPLLCSVAPQAYAVFLWLWEGSNGTWAAFVFSILGALGYESVYVGAIAWTLEGRKSRWTWATSLVALGFSVLVAGYVYYDTQGWWALLHSGFPLVGFCYTMALHSQQEQMKQDAIESPQPVALPIAPIAIASQPKAQPAIEAPVKKQEPTLAEMLRHFKKTREEMLALLKRFNLMDATPEHVYNSVSRYFPMPGDLTKERFGVLLAELKATPTKPAPATNLLEKLIREEIAEAEEQPADGLPIRAQVYAILDKRKGLKNEELYALMPGKNQGGIRAAAADHRNGVPLKKPKAVALSHNGNGHH